MTGVAAFHTRRPPSCGRARRLYRADASLRDIARRAGVGLGTLYRHFPTREAVLEAVLRKSFDALTVRARELEASVRVRAGGRHRSDNAA